MKKISILALILFSFSCSRSDHNVNNPVRGTDYTIHYAADSLAGDISVFYCFDYWGTKYNNFQGSAKLFENVLSPDSGRVASAQMVKDGASDYSVTIHIPDGVSLLSYYFTDGEHFDYNGRKTYTRYIYDRDGKPVENARFRMIDFLVMAGASKDNIIQEIAYEAQDHPRNWMAHIVYWRKRFQNAEDLSQLQEEMKNAESDYYRLVQTLGKSDSLKQVRAAHCLDFMNALNSKYYAVAGSTMDTFRAIMQTVPAEQQFGSMKESYDRILANEKSENEKRKFLADVKGQSAPDFEFTDLMGKKGKLSNFRGDYLLLDFWGTWCGPCVNEIPHLQKLYRKFHDEGFQILSICCDRMDLDDISAFIMKKNMPWEHVSETLGGEIEQLYHVNSYPSTFLLNPDGIVLEAGYESLYGDKLDTILEGIYSTK